MTANSADPNAEADCLRELHALLIRHFADFDAFAAACLEAGRKHLGLATGIVSHISGRDYEIVKVRTPLEGLHDSAHFDLSETYCQAVIERGHPVTYTHVGALPGMRGHPVYVGLRLESYIGVPIFVDGQVYGTLNFSDTRPWPRPFSARQIECVEAMAALLGRFLEGERIRQDLAERQHLFERSFHHALIGKALLTPEKRLIEVNPALCRLLGRSREEIIERGPEEFTHPEDRHLTDAPYRRLLAGETDHVTLEKRYLRADGAVVHGRVGLAMVRRDDGRPWLIIAQVVDITAEKRRERQLQSLLEAVPDAFLILDAALTIVHANAGAERLFGYPRAALEGRTAGMLMPEALREAQMEQLRALAATNRSSGVVDHGGLRGLRPDGSEFPCEISFARVEGDGGRQLAVTVRDVSERLRLQARLEHLAHSDPLTGLPNRRAFDQALAREQARLRRSGRAFSLVLIDLDHFKRINDRWSHPMGDRVLLDLARLLERSLRASDLPARLGGEEFGLLLPDTDLGAAGVLAERLRQQIGNAHWPVPGVSASFGVAAQSEPQASVQDLYRRADQALYQAKAAGRDRVMLDAHGNVI